MAKKIITTNTNVEHQFPVESLPYFQMVEDITDVKLNPYSETLRVACENFLEPVARGYTIRDYFNWTPEERQEYFDFLNGLLKPYNFDIVFQSQDGDYYTWEYRKDGATKMLLNFYLRDGYEKGEEGMKFGTLEMNFVKWGIFDWTKTPADNSFFDFLVNGEQPQTLDCAAAILLTLAEYDTFVREYKSRLTVVKNCQLLADKLIKPLCENYDCTFRQYEILVTAAYNGNIYARKIPYDGYANNFRDFVEKLSDIVNGSTVEA